MSTPMNFVSRAAWGSAFNYGDNTRMPLAPKGVALHWEGSPMGSFSHDQCDNHLRSIERYHTDVKGWAGIAYNAVVCPHGYIFEGRGTRYRSAANGDVPQNNSHFAVCYLGGKGDVFTKAGEEAFIRAVQWLRSDGSAGSQVIGHRDLFSTECPGSEIYDWLKRTNFSAGVSTPPVTSPAPQFAVWDLPSTWKIGSVGPAVTKLGARLVIWAAYLGLPAPYRVGPGPEFTETDREAVAAFQRAQGWEGADADGYPGPETFRRLALDPPLQGEETPLNLLHWNVAGSDANNGYGAKNATRGPAVGEYAASIGFDVFLACEAGQDDLRLGINKGVGLHAWMQRAKAIWFNPKTVKNISSRKAYYDSLFSYLNTRKWGAAFFGEKDGIPFSTLEIHTDYRAPAKQAKQVKSIADKWRKDTDALGIDHRNTYVVGDFNWDGTSGDNPFTALSSWNFEEKGDCTAHTFLERKHLDGVLAHVDADVEVEVMSRRKLSDHNPLKIVARLIRPTK